MKLAPAFLLITACVPPTTSLPDEDVDAGEDLILEHEPSGPALEVPPPQFVAIEAPKAAGTPRSLFSFSLANRSPLAELIETGPKPRDVVEQRIVTLRDEPVNLEVELTPPTGTFARTIVSDVQRPGVQQALNVQCTTSTGLPVIGNTAKCRRTEPETTETPADGPITASTWKLIVVDEQTQTPVSTCIESGTNRIACTLPPRANIGYRIIASANGFANLWDGRPGLGEQTLDGQAFTGAILPTPDFQCFAVTFPNGNTNGAMFCGAALVFTRFVGLDRASLAFDPIELQISANGIASTWESPALTWDGGNANLPGANF